jgi:hypothetical protein
MCIYRPVRRQFIETGYDLLLTGPYLLTIPVISSLHSALLYVVQLNHCPKNNRSVTSSFCCPPIYRL